MLILDFIASVGELYEMQMAPLSRAFGLTAMELSILLFLANNPEYDTATEIVKKRHLTKSHVSISLRSLEARGYIRKEHRDGDRKTAHLTLLPAADEITAEGQKQQAEFLSVLTGQFSAEEIAGLRSCITRMNDNVLDALKIRKEAPSI